MLGPRAVKKLWVYSVPLPSSVDVQFQGTQRVQGVSISVGTPFPHQQCKLAGCFPVFRLQCGRAGCTFLSMPECRTMHLISLRRYDMNGIFQMQGGKNWFLPK
jgi:hypothetical protein